MPTTLSRVERTIILTAVATGFGQFGAVASLDDVAHHFGSPQLSTTIHGVVGLSGSTLGAGLATLRVATLLALPLVAMADRCGRQYMLRRMALLGLVVTACASLSPSYWFFVACFACARPLLTASNSVLQVIMVEISESRRRVFLLAWLAAGSGIGAGLSAVLHGLIRGPNSFRLLFALALIPAMLVAPRLGEIPETKGERASQRLGAIARSSRGSLGIVATVALTMGVIAGPANGFAFVYGEGILKISPHTVALVVGLSAFTGVVGLFVSRFFADRWGRRSTVAVGVVATALTSTLAYSGGSGRFIAGYLLGVFAAGIFAPAASALVNENFPRDQRATAAGWVVVAGVVGAVIGLGVFGALADSFHGPQVTSSLRLAALWTFLPALPLMLVLQRLPETMGQQLD